MGLGQTELLVPPPTRRVIARGGATDVWGVDPSTQRCAIAVASPLGDRGELMSFSKTLDGAERLVDIYQRTRVLALEVWGAARPPALIVVEEPSGFGKRPNPELAYAAGVIMCALGQVLPMASLVTVASAKWKKDVCGYGAIKKPKAGEGEYSVLTWARDRGYGGTSWDLADAWAIAEWGRRTYALESR